MLAHIHYIESAYKNIQADKEYRWYQTTTIKVWEDKRTKTKRSMNEKKISENIPEIWGNKQDVVVIPIEPWTWPSFRHHKIIER